MQDGSSLEFEQGMTELRLACQRLEDGNLTLEESLVLYERATSLATSLQQKLDQVKSKMTVEVLGQDGKRMQLAPRGKNK